MAFTPFENDVKQYGTQASSFYSGSVCWFENDVKQYGTQAHFLNTFIIF